MYNDLLMAYDAAKRRAAMNGVPISRNDMMKSLYPVYQQYSKDAIAAKSLNQNRELFDKNLAFRQKIMDESKHINYANLAISGLGAIGTGLYANQQDDLYRQKLNLLLKMYGGK